MLLDQLLTGSQFVTPSCRCAVTPPSEHSSISRLSSAPDASARGGRGLPACERWENLEGRKPAVDDEADHVGGGAGEPREIQERARAREDVLSSLSKQQVKRLLEFMLRVENVVGGGLAKMQVAFLLFRLRKASPCAKQWPSGLLEQRCKPMLLCCRCLKYAATHFW